MMQGEKGGSKERTDDAREKGGCKGRTDDARKK